MHDELLASYTEIPYQSEPVRDTHPDWLATLAFLAGTDPTPVDRCRVLELGCAQGWNLIAMAAALPGSEFVGVDLAPNQIEEGRAILQATGTRNVRLEALDLMQVGQEFGQFDYVIAHGLYSWVPPAVQERILQLCHDRLAPGGVAYVSYNTYPGWSTRRVARDAMLYHAGETGDLKPRLAAGRDLMRLFAEAVVEHAGSYGRALDFDVRVVLGKDDSYIGHEYLEPWNEPIYFHQFVSRIQKHGLQYLGDARFSKNYERLAREIARLRPELASDPLRFEQYADFAFGRQFRRSLLVRGGLAFQRVTDPARVQRCYVSGAAVPDGAVDPRPGVQANFRTADGATASIADPACKVALAELATVLPLPVPFDVLWHKVAERLRLPGPQEDQRRQFARNLLTLQAGEMIELHRSEPRFVRHVSARPVASPLARFQAARNLTIHTRRHTTAKTLNDLDRRLLPLLDGTRDLAALSSAAGPASPFAGSPSPEDLVRASLDRLVISALLIG